jgi:hypothetical protein
VTLGSDFFWHQTISTPAQIKMPFVQTSHGRIYYKKFNNMKICWLGHELDDEFKHKKSSNPEEWCLLSEDCRKIRGHEGACLPY